MRTSKKKVDDIERHLFAAFRSQESAMPDADWQESVMGEIRRLGAIESALDDRVLFGRFAWRFSVAACLVALVLLAYVFSSGLVDYQDLAMRYLENPIDFII